MPNPPVTLDELNKIDAYWRAAYYLCAGMIYLKQNPLLRRPLEPADILPSTSLLSSIHGYPWLLHKLTYRRTNHDNLHVRGYKERGSINTPLGLAIDNQTDRFNLAIDVINRVAKLQTAGAHVKEWLKDEILDHQECAFKNGIAKPNIRDWRWPC